MTFLEAFKLVKEENAKVLLDSQFGKGYEYTIVYNEVSDEIDVDDDLVEIFIGKREMLLTGELLLSNEWYRAPSDN